MLTNIFGKNELNSYSEYTWYNLHMKKLPSINFNVYLPKKVKVKGAKCKVHIFIPVKGANFHFVQVKGAKCS